MLRIRKFKVWLHATQKSQVEPEWKPSSSFPLFFKTCKDYICPKTESNSKTENLDQVTTSRIYPWRCLLVFTISLHQGNFPIFSSIQEGPLPFTLALLTCPQERGTDFNMHTSIHWTHILFRCALFLKSTRH